MNKVILSGRLISDPELKTGEKWRMAEFALKVADDAKKGEFNEIDCKCFNNTCDVAVNYLTTGSKIIAEGAISVNQWEKDGKEYKKQSVIVRNIEFVSDGNNVNNEKKDVKASTKRTTIPQDDDIPF